MKPIPDSELDRLLSDFADDRLAPEDEARLAEHLRQNPEARRAYLAYSALESQLQWSYAEAATEPITPIRTARFGGAIAWSTALAAAVAVCLVAIVVLFQSVEKDILTVTYEDGILYRQGNEEAVELLDGDRFPAGTFVIEDADGFAEIEFDDGTQMSLQGETELDFGIVDGQKFLYVNKGRLLCAATPQPAGKPIQIRTGTAEIEVLGTVLTVDSSEDLTDLSVVEGEVKFRRVVDGQAVLVSAERKARATLDDSKPLASREVGEPGGDWRFDFHDDELRTGVTKGEFDIADSIPVLSARHYVAERDAEGSRTIRNGIAINGTFVDTDEADGIRIRYQASGHPQVFLMTNRRNGRFTGNFMAKAFPDLPDPDPTAWHEAVIPFSAFRAGEREAGRKSEFANSQVTKILISVGAKDQLVVSDVEIHSEL